MGIYIYKWKKLREYLINDENDKTSSNDFGKNIIPNMLANGERLFTYAFSGYWKDVGTIDSLWEANMDLLDPKTQLNLYDPSWKIYSRNPVMPPHYVSDKAKVENSMVTEGCVIEGRCGLFHPVCRCYRGRGRYCPLLHRDARHRDQERRYSGICHRSRERGLKKAPASAQALSIVMTRPPGVWLLWPPM